MNKSWIIIFFVFSCVKWTSLQLISVKPLPPDSKEDIDTRFYLHTKSEPNADKYYRVSAYDLTSLINSSFDPKKETIFIAHGYFHNGKRQWLKDMALALLQYRDCNVIIVDWGRGSFTAFDIAISNTKVVGEEIAFFIKTIIEKLGFSQDLVYCIGHSLGAHVCGFAGQGVPGLGRITGLDAASEHFHKQKNPNEKLDPTDAGFVDFIHTDTKFILNVPHSGIREPSGNIDIYVNGGEAQPECNITSSMLSNLYQLKNLENPLDLVVEPVFCDHMRVFKYYTESILNPACQWVAYECPSYEMFQKGECASCGDDNSKCAFLGIRASEYPDKSREYVKFHIKTAAEPPFCVRHYVVRVSIGVVDGETVGDGVLTFEVFGSGGNFSNEFRISTSDHGSVKKSLFIDRVDVQEISSVNLTWESDTVPSVIGIISVKVSPLSHYPESVRKDMEAFACLSNDGTPTTINDEETETFPVADNCIE